MLRLSLVVLERDERAVLRCLGRLGVVQLTRCQSGPETAPLAPRDRSKELARCDHLLARIEELRRSLEIVSLIAEVTEPVETSQEQADERISQIEKRAADLLQRRQHLLQRWGELTAVGQQVSSYRGWDVPLDQFDHYSFLHFVTGNLPAGNLDRLQQGIADNVALLPLPERAGRQPIIVMTTFRGRAALEAALQRSGFEREVLPAVAGATTDTLSEQSRREQEQVSASLETLNAELRVLAVEAAQPLATIERIASVERRLIEAEQHFPRTEVAVLLTGWAPAEDAPKLEQMVSEITNGRCVMETAATDDAPEDPIPVLLRHPRLLRPFEMLVSAYGLPSYHELEPTLFVALSYVLMFGMMFGDAGHGAVLAVGGLFALFAGRTAKMRDAGVLILFAALSSIVFGITYGSCFGLESLKQYALWHDPLEGDPMALMYGSIGIGIVMISLGLILNIINRFRRGDVIGGLLDKFGVIGVLFYWGVLALIAKSNAIESRGLLNVAIVLFLVLPLVGWSLKEPIEYFVHRQAKHSAKTSEGLFGAITESLVGAFEAVLSYLANTISFVRLAAYAMSHAALLVAAFMMAEEVRHLPVGGDFLSVLVIILGNVVAIVLEGIIASVQALRLEYYEFFGKFFSGNGRPFKPFRLTAAQT